MTFENFTAAHHMVLWGTLALSVVMGAVANKTNFCTMGAVSDWVNMGDTGRMRAWLFAMAIAMLGVVALEYFQVFNVDASRPPYRGTNFAWIEYLVGGILFGVGMTLGSGCGNKTLIRIGGGNLKSIVVFAVISICAYFMMNPFPGTDKTLYSELFYPWTQYLNTTLASKQDLGSLAMGAAGGFDAGTLRLGIGGILGLAIVGFAFKSVDFRGRFDNILGGLVVGVVVVAAWYVSASMVTIDSGGEKYTWTQYASDDVWVMVESAERPQDIGVQSFSFINPIGQVTRYGLNRFDERFLTFGVVSVVGVILGSLLWALLSRGFRFEWFASVRDFVYHFVGAILMGVGGILALGCTIGQAITGASTLALGSFIAFAGIVLGSALTMKVQYYKMVYEDASLLKVFLTALVEMRLLPSGLRQLEKV